MHCPSTCVDFYKDIAVRRRATDAPFAKSPIELATTQRWGTAWCWPDKSREPELPIDDSDMGCDCVTQCKIDPPWKRQIATIEIDEARDAITDNGQELYNLFAQRGIENVMICGVHLNMCVLGRPFGIRQLTRLGKNVVLVRDMTDTMYNHRMRRTSTISAERTWWSAMSKSIGAQRSKARTSSAASRFASPRIQKHRSPQQRKTRCN